MASTDDPFGILSAFGCNGADLLSAMEAIKASASANASSAAADYATVRPGDSCPDCCCVLVVHGISYECPECQKVFEAADISDVMPTSSSDGPNAMALRGRLRVVGPDAGYYQPDLDRTNPGKTVEMQKETTFQELVRYNKDYESRGGHPFPHDVLSDVAEIYCIVQKANVKRSMMKKRIYAALLNFSCVQRGFTRSRAECAQFAKLSTHGIAPGEDYIRGLDEDVGLGIDLNASRLGPHITTVFACLGRGQPEFARLRALVAKVVEIAEGKNIGYDSILRSKVVAVSYEVLRRSGEDITLDFVSVKCKIRKHTIRKFLDALDQYRSHFSDAFAELESSPAGK